MRYRMPRRASRKQVTILTPTSAVTGTVRNYSRTGLGLSGLPPLPAGTTLIVRVIGADFPVRLIWQRGTLAGAQFLRVLGHQEAQVFGLSGGAHQPVSWRAQHAQRQGPRPYGS